MKGSTLTFDLPETLNATCPPERRGVRRDHVRLMVLDKLQGHTKHNRFHHLGDYLSPGDLIVLNSSRTLPAELRATVSPGKGKAPIRKVTLRLAHQVAGDSWEVFPLKGELEEGDHLSFSENLEARVTSNASRPFVTLRFTKQNADLFGEIYKIGEPIRYEYISDPWELDYYQTVYATEPGSVEMPSAGRAFSWELLFELKRRGIKIAFLQLHAGLSDLADNKWQLTPRDVKESFQIPLETIESIKETKAKGGRVIAVGTTVVRAIETAFDSSIKLISGSGWTNLYINRETVLKVIDGLITGFHEPEASHLDLLTAFIDQKLLFQAYQEAIDLGYLWHEFGDINLIL
jgi:S-adenosylmethionine:tRNA ribosyltransferase-isomerase